MRLRYFASMIAVLVVFPAEASASPTVAKPANNPGRWVTTSDYPSHLIVAGAEGVVGFELAIDAKGIPIKCTIIRSSDISALDDLACTKIMERARFSPATDENGNPVSSLWSNQVKFVIPQGAKRRSLRRTIPEGEVEVEWVVENDGMVSSCEIIQSSGDLIKEIQDEDMCDAGQRNPILNSEGIATKTKVKIHISVTHEHLD